MLNKKLLLVVLSTLLCPIVGCGQKGPLYEEPSAPENQEKSSAQQADEKNIEQ